jgi:hypothetical protein
MTAVFAHVCPTCGGDRNKDLSSVKRILAVAGCKGAVRDPGGVLVNMADGSSFRIGGECNACDERTIVRFVMNRE